MMNHTFFDICPSNIDNFSNAKNVTMMTLPSVVFMRKGDIGNKSPPLVFFFLLACNIVLGIRGNVVI